MEEIQEHPSQSIGKDDEDDIVKEQSADEHGDPLQHGNLLPKVDSAVEILQEKVTKQVVKEGHGQKPSKYATCFLHYRAWTESTQHKFEDTWHEQRPFEMVLGKEKKEMAGLAVGVSSMKAGERALLHVGWELGYGKEGSFSFPNVPPMANIIYEVELIGFDEVKEIIFALSDLIANMMNLHGGCILQGKSRGDMTAEERIGTADRRKMDGNSLFKDEKLEEAMQQYEMAIAYLGDDFMFQLFGKYRDMALAVKNPCHLNMAACLIKLKRHEEAIAQCTITCLAPQKGFNILASSYNRLLISAFVFAVLAEDENNAKALFRRGKARAELGQTDAAREDFVKARKHAPEDKAITRELRLLDEHDKAVYKKQKEIYKGIFGPPPQPKPANVLNRIWEWLILIYQWLLALIYRLFKRERHKAD
ncbi:hypothetical protein SADUNF_Sadunf16G0151600 [Salix dunnii]|uniref:peptidylprolyl isomerase n=1 Tax=Salix dunnii TaxID=1413687 RepID=A0A835MGL1_9ROSI|nr:hypothetical protein SADUNF_Sadunf16G0151600 [Salix dunnii]